MKSDDGKKAEEVIVAAPEAVKEEAVEELAKEVRQLRQCRLLTQLILSFTCCSPSQEAVVKYCYVAPYIFQTTPSVVANIFSLYIVQFKCIYKNHINPCFVLFLILTRSIMAYA